ncbi:septal ring lytic transglycosylase RlpA family protein [Candidatus Binatia bacterium]|nr:septal ring lytic transglycosylase RlpA family protein [Candidatus Binatia bacterium]
MATTTTTRLLTFFTLILSLTVGAVATSHALDFGSWPVARGWQQVTHASWYGREFAGRRTAMGRRFNPNELTAAHRSLELGTWVRVTDLSSGRSVVVQITDRGPYKYRRGIDLSYEAARRLGMVSRGVARVLIELASAPAQQRDAAVRRNGRATRAEALAAHGKVVGTDAVSSSGAWLAAPRLEWRPPTAAEG